MAAIHQPWYAGAPAIPACFELIQFAEQQWDPVLGMNTGGPAITARNLFLTQLASYVTADMNHLAGGPVSTTTRIRSNLPRSIWSGLGTMTTDSTFETAYIGTTSSSSDYPGRFNTSSTTAGNWLDTDAAVNIALSSPRNAFCCYITDMGDFTGSVTLIFSLGAAVVKTVAVPYQDMNTAEVLHVGYLNGAVLFDKIRIQINQNTVFDPFDSVGFDDLVVGLALPCTPP